MIRQIEAATPGICCTVQQIPSVGSYLRALSALCAEVVREPRLFADFIAILRLVPTTIAALEWAQQRLAA